MPAFLPFLIGGAAAGYFGQRWVRQDDALRKDVATVAANFSPDGLASIGHGLVGLGAAAPSAIASVAGYEDTFDNAVGRFALEQLQASTAADERARALTGASPFLRTDPVTGAVYADEDSIAGEALTAIMPVGLAARAAARAAGLGARAVTHAAPSTARVVATNAAEMLTPGVTGRNWAPGAGISAGATAGLQVGTAELLSPSEEEQELLKNIRAGAFEDSLLKMFDEGLLGQPQPQQPNNRELVTLDLSGAVDNFALPTPADPSVQETWMMLVGGGVTAFGLGSIGSALRQSRRNRRYLDAIQDDITQQAPTRVDPEELGMRRVSAGRSLTDLDSNAPGMVTTRRDRAASMFDSAAPIINVLRRNGAQAAADDIGRRLSATEASVLSARAAQSMFRRGFWTDNTRLFSQSPSDTLNATARFTPEQRADLNRYMYFRDWLEQRELLLRNSATRPDVAGIDGWGRFKIADMEAEVKRIEQNNPEVAALGRQMNNDISNIHQWMQKHNLIIDDMAFGRAQVQVAKETGTNRTYMQQTPGQFNSYGTLQRKAYFPKEQNKVASAPWYKLYRAPSEQMNVADNLLRRNTLKDQLLPGDLKDTTQAYKDYLFNMYKYSFEQIHTRMTLNELRKLGFTSPRNGQTVPVLEKVSGVNPATGRDTKGRFVVSVLERRHRDAKHTLAPDEHNPLEQVFYAFNDPLLGAAMQNNSKAISPFFSTIAGINAQSVVGVLNPTWAATKGTFFEVAQTIMLAPKGMSTGPLSEAAFRLAGNNKIAKAGAQALARVDVTAFAAPFTGAARMLAANMSDALNKSLARQLTENSSLVRVFGRNMIEKIQKRAHDAYFNSFTAMAEAHGISSHRYLPDIDFDTAATRNRRIATEYAKRNSASFLDNASANRVFRTAIDMINAFHTSYRVDTFARNYKRFVTDANSELTKMMRDQGASAQAIKRATNQTNAKYGYQVRTASGDFTKTAGLSQFKEGNAFQTYASTVPFSTALIHGIAAHVRAARQAPTRYTINVTASLSMYTGLAALLFAAFPEEMKREYVDARSPAERLRSLPVFSLEGEVLFEFPIVHEMRPFFSMVMESMIFAGGLEDERLYNMNLTSGFFEGMLQGLPIPSSTAASAIDFGIHVLGGDAGVPELNSRFGSSSADLPDMKTGNQHLDSVVNGAALLTDAIVPGIAQFAVESTLMAMQEEDIVGFGSTAYKRVYTNERTVNTLPFFGAENVYSRATAEGDYIYNTRAAIEPLLQEFTQTVRAPGNSRATYGPNTLTFNPPASLRGTEYAVVMNAAARTMNEMTKQFFQPTNDITKQIESLKRDPFYANGPRRNAVLRILHDTNRGYAERAYSQLSDIEEAIGDLIGDEGFTFASYDYEAGKLRPIPQGYQQRVE